MFNWFDSHIHLFAPEWQQSPELLHQQSLAVGITKMLMPGVRVADWPQLLELARQLPGVYLAPGLHPVYAEQWDSDAEAQLLELASDPNVVAIGEIGLDGIAGPDRAQQEQVLRSQLALAVNMGLPVLLHSRNATGHLLDILRELKIGEKVGGVWHGFSGSVQTAQELVDLGFKVGVGPILLRQSARKLPQAVQALNGADFLLETDAPDMIASPSGLIDVATRVAELKGLRLSDVAELTTTNALSLFEKVDKPSG